MSVQNWCKHCGGGLALLSSQNCKICPDCGEFPWELDDDQDSIYGDRKAKEPQTEPIKVVDVEATERDCYGLDQLLHNWEP
jgi:hypothetical protein